MSPWQLLISTDYGIASLIVIAITLGMGLWFFRFFLKHAKDQS